MFGKTRDLFAIDVDTGVLSTAMLLDRETNQYHELTVRVADKDMPEWFCESRVSLQILDANDNKPMWDTDEFNANIHEDANVGQIVTKMHATDIDLGDNRRLTYTLIDSADGYFDIEEENGLIRVARELDREMRDVYNLTVRAMDAGRPRLTAVTNLLIRVLGNIILLT